MFEELKDKSVLVTGGAGAIGGNLCAALAEHGATVTILDDLSSAARWNVPDHPNVKFSNSPGKESLGGYLRVYGRDDTLVIADASEPPQGEPLFVQLVEAGRIVYGESFDAQADRADRTWGRYRRWTLSPVVHEYQERFRAMRAREVAAARQRLGPA